MEETTQNNILLAEFLGMLTINSYGDIKEDVNSFKFHNSWDWLMEVVEKINDLGHVVTIRSSGYVQIEGEEIPFIIEEDGDNPLQSTYDACVEFVKWYNENRAPERVVIEDFDGAFYLYDESGSVVDDPEPFDSYEDARQYAIDNGYDVVKSFYL